MKPDTFRSWLAPLFVAAISFSASVSIAGGDDATTADPLPYTLTLEPQAVGSPDSFPALHAYSIAVLQNGDWAILGGFSIVHQFCHIGAHCFTGMGSVISKDVPPYVTIGGNPAKPHGINSEGLRRRGFGVEQIAVIKRAYKTLYTSGLPLAVARQQITEAAAGSDELQVMAEFLAASERSIVR